MSSICKATTTKGFPCKCKAKQGSDYCGRHKDCFECPICYTTNKDKIITKCGHSFCKSCIDKWTKSKNTCPICRTQLTETEEPKKVENPPSTTHLSIIVSMIRSLEEQGHIDTSNDVSVLRINNHTYRFNRVINTIIQIN